MRSFKLYKKIFATGIINSGACSGLSRDLDGNPIETDWMIYLEYLPDFLSLPEDAALGVGYKKTDVKDFLVYTDRGLSVALFTRIEPGKYDYTITAKAHLVPQMLWELMYPNTRERAIAKAQNIFFAGLRQHSWYFVGKTSGDLYAVIPEYRPNEAAITNAFCYDLQQSAAADGFDVARYEHSSTYLPIEVLNGTDYDQQKIETPEAILALADKQLLILHSLVKRYGFTMCELGLEEPAPSKLSIIEYLMGWPKNAAYE